ncbi:MAG: hypothetical protein NTX72_04685 [Candidatus Uhrbacteria bacterium]|nr:hypothetical protein [Candidatus Uhrbacteria bacterium]
MKNLNHVLLYDVDNDAESRLIFLIALAAGITVVRSSQPHGASLERENGALELVRASRKTDVWTVELPGLATENQLRRHGLNVIIIDHHTYSGLDRVHDEHGNRKKSSLEQFLALAEITDDDLRAWGFDPRLVLGIGVMDDRYTKGLRSEGFAPEEVRRVLAYRELLDRQITPEYDLITKTSRLVWKNRRKQLGYIICTSTSNLRVSYAIGNRSIEDALEEHPIIIADRGGRQVYVNNISLDLIPKLETAFAGHRTFTYGSGRCWGIDNDVTDLPNISIEEILTTLTQA